MSETSNLNQKEHNVSEELTSLPKTEEPTKKTITDLVRNELSELVEIGLSIRSAIEAAEYSIGAAQSSMEEAEGEISAINDILCRGDSLISSISDLLSNELNKPDEFKEGIILSLKAIKSIVNDIKFGD